MLRATCYELVSYPGEGEMLQFWSWDKLSLSSSTLCIEVSAELSFNTGKKRGATVRLSNVTVNAPSVLKHEEELESLAALMPADYDARRK